MNDGMLCEDEEKQERGIPIPDDDSLENLIAAIAGGIEAPIQFTLQVTRILHWNMWYLVEQ